MKISVLLWVALAMIFAAGCQTENRPPTTETPRGDIVSTTIARTESTLTAAQNTMALTTRPSVTLRLATRVPSRTRTRTPSPTRAAMPSKAVTENRPYSTPTLTRPPTRAPSRTLTPPPTRTSTRVPPRAKTHTPSPTRIVLPSKAVTESRPYSTPTITASPSPTPKQLLTIAGIQVEWDNGLQFRAEAPPTYPPAKCYCCDENGVPDTIYVYDLSRAHFNYYDYCLTHSSPGQYCDQFTAPPDGKDFATMLRDYDTILFAATLQGLVNRGEACLYLYQQGTQGPAPGIDQHWLAEFRRGDKPYGWLADRELHFIADLDELLARFAGAAEGVVLWDDAVPATLNAATTIAGVDNLAVLRAGSELEEQVTAYLPVKKSLVGKFKRKTDVYKWLLRDYMTNPTLLAQYLDGYPAARYKEGKLTRGGLFAFERDYAVQNRAFVFDLSPWPETPNDAPYQGKWDDLDVLKRILKTARRLVPAFGVKAGDKPFRVLGFTPWAAKYSNYFDAGGIQPPAASEWESVWLFSHWGGYIDAGAGELNGLALTNLSFHSHAPPPPPLPPNEKRNPSREELAAQGYLTPEGEVAPRAYLLHYCGDYDLAHNLLIMLDGSARPWRDGKRGWQPLAWGINPGLIDLLPDVWAYLVATRTENDYFVGPNSGAGYTNPGSWTQLPLSAWIDHSLPYYERMGYTIQGWILNGPGGIIPEGRKREYARLAPDGMAFDGWAMDGEWPRLIDGVPATMVYLPPETAEFSAEGVVAQIHDAYNQYRAAHEEGPVFIIYRNAWSNPTFLWQVTEQLKADAPEREYTVVDPYTFFALMRMELEK